MDDLLLFPLIFTFLLGPLIIIFTRRARNKGPSLPPGPWKLPLIGNIHNLLGALPHRTFYKLSRRYGPIMHLKLGQIHHVIISTPEAAREIHKIHDMNFTSRPQLIAPTILFGNHDITFSPYWRQLRKISTLELLTARRVKSFAPIREAENLALVKSLATSGKSPIDLTEKLMLLSYSITTRAAFGSECKHGDKITTEIKKILELLSGFEIADLFPSIKFLGGLLGTSGKLQRIRSRIDAIFDEIIEEHKARKSTEEYAKEESLIDVLLRLEEKGGLDFPFSTANVKGVILELLTAGTETSSTTLVWAMAELMRHPVLMEKVQEEVCQAAKGKGKIEEDDVEEMPYMKLVIKETLRLHPPGPLLVPRVNQERCIVGGFEIPERTRVIINAWAIARDPRYWEDAESFKPDRFEGSSVDFRGESCEYLPFGAGRRICPGIGYGLANMELTLAHLLYHFKWELPGDMKSEDLDMTEAFGAAVSPKSNLCLIATPRIMLPTV